MNRSNEFAVPGGCIFFISKMVIAVCNGGDIEGLDFSIFEAGYIEGFYKIFNNWQYSKKSVLCIHSVGESAFSFKNKGKITGNRKLEEI